MDSPHVILIIVLILFLFLTPDVQQPAADRRRELSRAIGREKNAVDVLKGSRYGDLDPPHWRWLNLTGLRKTDGYAWDLLQPVKDAASSQLDGLAGEGGLDKLNGGIDNGAANGTDGAHNVAAAQTTPSEIPLYRNVTGLVRGKWARSKLAMARPAPEVNLTALVPDIGYAAHGYKGNITGSSGDVQIKLDEKTGEMWTQGEGNIRPISATMTIKDETTSGDGWEISLHGVHYPDFGGIVMTTTSEKFAGLFALPHFTLSQHTYSLAQALLDKILSETINKQESSNPWSSSPGNTAEAATPVPRCEYLVYIQQHPTSVLDRSRRRESPAESSELLRLIEGELRFPSGAPVPKAPQLTMSMVVFSPDCGFVLESKGPPRFAPQEGLHLRGPKVETYMRLAKNYALMYGLLCSAQILLLIRQMARASTPSTVSRVSLYAIGIMAMGDGFASMTFLTVSMFVDAAFLTLVTTAFLSFIGVSFFGMKFLMEIWTVQAPERTRRERQGAANNNVNAASSQRPSLPAVVNTPAEADTLPPPATALPADNLGATPVILPPDQDLDAVEAEDAATTATPGTAGNVNTRREIGALYSRFYILLMAMIFLSLHATSWPTNLRSAYTNVLAFSYFSFWVPQIYRNIMRNTRKALAWEFVVGESVMRLLPFMYLYSVTDNILFVRPDRRAAVLLAGWVWVQMLLLVSQDLAGPRCFTPKGWAPPAYDYHPVLRADDLEAGLMMELGSSQIIDGGEGNPGTSGSAGERSKEKPTRTFDCAICTEHVEVPIVPSGGDGQNLGGTGLAGNRLRRSYMVTPCHHLYHSHCLEGWLRYRLQCPVCRSPCPPI
ncbi:MAG: hypothetical protein M1832_004241 [Thelocarpon impressellum]|nr:MAG: hypothetical protein M1832_004241 [Thelocarpon impressellum]